MFFSTRCPSMALAVPSLTCQATTLPSFITFPGRSVWIEDAAKGLTTNRLGLIVQLLRFMCISTGKVQDLPDSPQALESNLALASSSYRKAILALRDDVTAVQTLRQLAFRMVQAPQSLQQEPDAIIANWGQLVDRNADFRGGNLGLTGICPLAPSLMFILPDNDDYILRIPVAENSKAKLLGSPALDGG